VADRSEVMADLILEFGGHGAVADPCDVGLGDPDDLVHVTGMNAGAMGGVATGGDRRGHERIGPLVDVEEAALGSFEDDALT